MNEHVAAAESALRRLARQRASATRALAQAAPVEATATEQPVEASAVATLVWDETPTAAELMQLAQRAYTNWAA